LEKTPKWRKNLTTLFLKKSATLRQILAEGFSSTIKWVHTALQLAMSCPQMTRHENGEQNTIENGLTAIEALVFVSKHFFGNFKIVC
jgi:hypothetical protein